MMRRYIANIITGGRVIGAILLLFFQPFSVGFYVIYLLCGVSDMIDGAVARKTNSISGFGAKLDTVADAIFMGTVCYKLLPTVHLPHQIWVWIIVIATIKLSSIVFGLLRRKTLVSIHSLLNKVTGVVLFLLPLTIQVIEQEYSFTIACLIATFATIQELHYIQTGREII